MSTNTEENGFDFSDMYDAYSMTSATAKQIAKEFEAVFHDAVLPIDDIGIPGLYGKVENSLNNILYVLTGGSHLEFVKKNYMLSDTAFRESFRSAKTGQTATDKRDTIYLFDTIVDTTPFREEFNKFMTTLVSEILKPAHKALAYSINMELLADDRDYSDLVSGFMEFDAFYSRINSAKVFDEIIANRHDLDISSARVREITYKSLNRILGEYSDLSHFIPTVETYSADTYNHFHAIDRQTMSFWAFGGKKDKIINAEIECERLLNKAKSLTPKLNLGYTYFNGYIVVLEHLAKTLNYAVNIILNETDTSRKTLLRYPRTMMEFVNKNDFRSYNDPVIYGTIYSIFIKQMSEKIKHRSNSVYNRLLKDMGKT